MPSRRHRPTGARPIPLFRAVASGLVTIVAVASLLGTFAPTAAVADEDHWENMHQMVNHTEFEFRPVDQSKTEMTDWVHRPVENIPAGAEGSGVVRSADFSFGHGLAQILSYAVYDEDDYVGLIVFSSGIDCEKGAKICLDYHRWERTWSSPLTGEYKRFALVTDVRDGGTQHGYLVNTTVRLERIHTDLAPDSDRSSADSSSTDAPNADAPNTDASSPDDTTEPGSDDATALGQSDNLEGAPWAWRQTVQNQTPFDLHLGFTWLSQGTETGGIDPPQSIGSGANGAYSYVNSKTFHGPQMFTVYNAYRKGTSDYIGSVILEAQTDCNAGAKVPDLQSCIEFEWNSYSIATGSDTIGPQEWVLNAHSTTSGAPPLFAVASTTIRIEPAPTPEPTPTPTPTPEPTPGPTPDPDPGKTATSVVVQPLSDPIRSGSLFPLWGYVSFPPGDDKPTGTVSFYDGETLLGVGAVNPGAATYNASTVAQIVTQGQHRLRAVYSGDDNFTGSEASGTWTVEKPVPELSIQSIANPAPAGSSPMMAVQAFIPGASSLPDDGTVLVTASNDNTNRFQGTVKNGLVLGTLPKPLPAGDTEISATWKRDGVVVASDYFIQSVGTASTESMKVPADGLGSASTVDPTDAPDAPLDLLADPAPGDKAATTTSVLPFSDPIRSGSLFPLWGYVSFPPGDHKPTGTISFYDGETLLGVGDVNPGDPTYNASITAQIVTPGQHRLRAVYSGDDNFAGSEGSRMWSVDKATPQLSIQSSANPAPAGTPPVIVVQAFVPGDPSLPDDGTVLVTVGNDNSNRFDGSVKNGLVIGTFPKPLPAGDSEITASWKRNGAVVASAYSTQTISVAGVTSPEETPTPEPSSTPAATATATTSAGQTGRLADTGEAPLGAAAAAALLFAAGATLILIRRRPRAGVNQ